MPSVTIASRARQAVARASLILSFIACGGGGDAAGPEAPVTPVTPQPQASTLTVASGTVALGGTIPRKAWLGISLVPATWRSLNPAIASISSSGDVTGIAPGTATIEATTGQDRGTAEITVTDLRFTQLEVNGRH